MTLLTALGLSASPASSPIPNYAPYALIFNFVWALRASLLAHAQTILRPGPQRVPATGPRQKYGAAAVSSGKITQRQLDRLHRNEVLWRSFP